MKKLTLKNTVLLTPFSKILIDGDVDRTENGDLEINIGYIRVSTDRQAEIGYGLEVQETAILQYCKRTDVKNLLLFTDDGYTGTNMERPAIKEIIKMITDYNSGNSKIRINMMIVPRIDRLGRSLLGTLQFIQDYIVCKKDSKNSLINTNAYDIDFVSVAEPMCCIDRNNPQGKFLLMFFATLAEYDRDMIVQKMKNGRIARVAGGKWMGGGPAPHGYRYNRISGTLEIDEKEAENIKELFRLYIDEKKSPREIASLLGYKSDVIVTNILKRKSLTGCLTYLGQEYEGLHEPIISTERWEEAQEELRKRSRHLGKRYYLLSGLLYCGECGAKMRYQQWGNGTVKIYCYSVSKSKPELIKDPHCPSKKYRKEEIENAVLNELFKISVLQNENEKKENRYVDILQSQKEELQKAERKLKRLYLMEAENGENDILYDAINEAKENVEKLKNELQSEETRKKLIQKAKRTEKMIRDLKSTWQYMTDEEKKNICNELIEKVVVFRNGNIELHLKSENISNIKKEGSYE